MIQIRIFLLSIFMFRDESRRIYIKNAFFVIILNWIK